MKRDEVIRLFEEHEAPESITNEIEAQHTYFVNNLLTRRATMTKELYLKFLNERIEKASQGIQDCLNIQEREPNDFLFMNRLKVYRLCQKNIAFAVNETKKKHTPGPKETDLQFKDIFTGDNREQNARDVITILKANGFIINGRWINPEDNQKESLIATPLHVLQDHGAVIKKPVKDTVFAWCRGLGIEPPVTVKALTKRRKGGAEFEAEHDSDYRLFCSLFASVLNR